MKLMTTAAALFLLSLPVLGMQRVPEARCTGTQDGQAFTVTSYVNPQKWCSNVRRDMKSVVVIESADDLGVAYDAVATEAASVTRHVGVDRKDKMELILDMTSYPETGKLIRNSTSTELTCLFVQYELDC